MKFKLKLTLTKNPQGIVTRNLPINYQYELSSWIYRIINYGDSSFASWLHQQGYKTDVQKTFKLFAFSNLKIKEKKIEGDRLHILSDRASIEISFMPVEAIDTFVKGLFKEQEFSIGDALSRVWFKVSSVVSLTEPKFNETMQLRAVSPIFMDLRITGRQHPLHMSPEDEPYAKLLFDNLNDKYKAYKNTKFGFDTSKCAFRILSTPKRKVIAIKANTSAETKICGYLYDFEVTAPPELIRLGYYCGFGSSNSQGFGAVRLITKPHLIIK